MKVENIVIDKPIKLPIAESVFIEYLQKTGWNEELGLWRHESGKQFSPLNLQNMKKALGSLAEFEKRHIFDVWSDIMQAETERNI